MNIPLAAPTLDALRRELTALTDPVRAQHALRYFKIGPGQYGEGDRFLGIRVPELRRLVRRYRSLPLSDTLLLLRSEWHEERLLALLLMVQRFGKAAADERQQILAAYLAHTAWINNWDLVDSSAAQIVGASLGADRSLLDRLSSSGSLWERRIAVVATFDLIRRGDYGDTLRLCERLLSEREDLLHKACGWALREVGKRDLAVLREFLTRHAGSMPRTMLRYAIERLPAEERRRWLAEKRQA